MQKLIFFGGNRRNEDGPLLNLSLEAVNQGKNVVIFTDDFHWNLPTSDGKPLGERLKEAKKKGLEWKITQEITPKLIEPYTKDHLIGLSLNAIWIFKNEIIDMFGGQLYNYHNAKLPQERGAAIFSWKILSQSKEGALTVHKLTPKLDAGEIVKEKKITYPELCRIPADFYKYIEKHEKLFLMEFIEGKNLELIPQDETKSIYMPRLHTLTNGLINWNWSTNEIDLFINAFDDPHEGASTFLNTKKLHLKKCCPANEEVNFHPFQAGLVYRKNSESLFVAAKGTGLKIGEILDEAGSNTLSKVKLGQRLHTPLSLLEKSRNHLELPQWSKWWV
jgi:methionyl-tRNA formyltransferase